MKHCCWPVLLIFLLLGIRSWEAEPPFLAEMTSVDNGQYVVLVWEGRTYVPWGPVSPGDCGSPIGMVDGDRKDKVYAYRDEPREEWIVEYYRSGLMDVPILLREEHVTEIPPGLSSEYPWNNDE